MMKEKKYPKNVVIYIFFFPFIILHRQGVSLLT